MNMQSDHGTRTGALLSSELASTLYYYADGLSIPKEVMLGEVRTFVMARSHPATQAQSEERWEFLKAVAGRISGEKLRRIHQRIHANPAIADMQLDLVADAVIAAVRQSRHSPFRLHLAQLCMEERVERLLVH